MLTQDFFTSHKLSQELFALGVKSISGYWYDKDDKKSLYDSADVEDLNNACEGIEWIPAYLDSELLKQLPEGIDIRHDYYYMGDHMQGLLDTAEEMKDKKLQAIITELILAKDKLEDYLEENYNWD